MGNMFWGAVELPERVGTLGTVPGKSYFLRFFEVFIIFGTWSQIRARSWDFRDFGGSAAGIDHDMSMLGVRHAQTDHKIHQRDAQGNFSLNLRKTYRSVNFLSRFFQNFHENYLYILDPGLQGTGSAFREEGKKHVLRASELSGKGMSFGNQFNTYFRDISFFSSGLRRERSLTVILRGKIDVKNMS